MDDLLLTGGLGDLPDDIVGKTNHDLKLGENISDDALSKKLSSMLSNRVASNIHFVPNDASLAGIQNNNDMEAEKEKRKSDVIKMAKLKATLGKDANEIYQSLKQAFTDAEISGLPHLQDLLDKPFIWAMFIDDPSAFGSCDEAKSNLRRLCRNSLYVLSGPQCSGCTNNQNDLCFKLGKRLIKDLDFTPKMYGEISEALRMHGLIKPDRSVYSVDELKNVFSHKKEASGRVYNAPKRETTPKISLDDAMLQLHAQSTNKEAEEIKYKRGMFLDTEGKPMAQKLYALIYKNASVAEIKHQVESQLFSPESQGFFPMLFKELDGDPLIKSHLAFPPIIFSTCEQAKTFMAKNGIKVGYIKSFAKCESCNNKEKGFCLLLGGTLLAPNTKVAEHDRLIAIDELCVGRQITDAQAKTCRELEKTKYLTGLREAQKMSGLIPNRTSSHIALGLNSDVDLTNQFVDKSNALKSAINQLSSVISISSVRNMLQSQLGEAAADSIIEDAIFSMPAINANVLDDCTYARHQFRQGAVIVKTDKCSLCQYASDMGCSKTKLTFGTGELPRIANVKETPEAREIIDMFHDPDKIIDAEPYAKITGIQIEMNPDSGNEYDFGSFFSTDLPDMSVPDMTIDVNPRTSAETGLDIEDLGGGWNIEGCF
jgi:hypothetical protein